MGAAQVAADVTESRQSTLRCWHWEMSGCTDKYRMMHWNQLLSCGTPHLSWLLPV